MKSLAIPNTGEPNLTKRDWPLWSRFGKSTTAGKEMLNQDFKEFIASLNDNRVRYLVVGGYAVAFHGHPRYTKDIDIWLQCSAQNAECVLQALRQFGFGSLDIEKQDFLTPDIIVQLGYPPRRIDLLTSLPGVDFEECYAQRVQATVDGIDVSFIDVENLKKNKRAAGRHQDLADVDSLG